MQDAPLRSSLWFTSPRCAEIVAETAPLASDGEVQIRSRCSAISHGTELLAYRGQLPMDLTLDDRLEGMQKRPEYPMKYGYCGVGKVVRCGEHVPSRWADRRVFAFHPHESDYTARPDTLVPLPDAVSDEDALFLANLETAIGLVMDGRPGIGDRVLVLGAGIVGQLLTALLAQMLLADLAVCDGIGRRQTWALRHGATRVMPPEELADARRLDADLVFEVSGNPEALNLALRHTRYHGRIVVGSWYGAKTAPIALGGRFHREKITIYSSQVSDLDPGWSGRWDKQRRLQYALSLLPAIRPSRMITHAFSFERAPEAYATLDAPSFDGMQAIFVYQ